MKSREEGSLLCVGRGASGPLSNKIHSDLTKNYTQILYNKMIPRKIPKGGKLSSPKSVWHFSYMAIFAGNLPHVFSPTKTIMKKVKVCHGKVNNCDYWRPTVNDKFNSV